MIILIYLLKMKLASNFLDDSSEPKQKFDASQFERSPFFQDFFPIDDCVHHAKDTSLKDLEVLDNNQYPETDGNSGKLQKLKIREDDRDDRKVVKAKIYKKKRPFLKKQDQLDIRDLSTDNLRIRIRAFKISPSFNRKLRVERDLYETIFQMEEFLKTERKLLGIPINLEDIGTICSKIKQAQLGPSPNDILYLIYTCFVTQAFKGFNNQNLYAKTSILSLEQESDVFYEEDILISFVEWRNLRFKCNTFDQAYHHLMNARNLISPHLDGIMSDLFDLQYEYKMLEGLRYFYD